MKKLKIACSKLLIILIAFNNVESAFAQNQDPDPQHIGYLDNIRALVRYKYYQNQGGPSLTHDPNGKLWLKVAYSPYSAGRVCAISVEHILYCAGDNYHDLLGTGLPSASGGPYRLLQYFSYIEIVKHIQGKIIDVGLSSTHLCALTHQQDLYCWGENSYGELGLGFEANNRDKVNIAKKVPIPNNEKVVHFKLFDSQTTAVLTDKGNIYWWGWNILHIPAVEFGMIGKNPYNYPTPKKLIFDSKPNLKFVDFIITYGSLCAKTDLQEIYCVNSRWDEQPHYEKISFGNRYDGENPLNGKAHTVPLVD